MNWSELTLRFDAVRAILDDPTKNLTAAALLLALFALFVLVLIVAVLMLLYLAPARSRSRAARARSMAARRKGTESSTDDAGETDGGVTAGSVTDDGAASEPPAEDEDGPAGEADEPSDTAEIEEHSGAASADVPAPRAPRKKAWLPRWAYTAAMIVIASVTVVWAYAESGKTEFCVTLCHQQSPAVASAAKDVHAKVACVDCHGEPPVTGAVQNVTYRLTYGFASLARMDLATRPVPSRRCLACHASVLTKVARITGRGLLVEHGIPNRAGMDCSDCHRASGHGTRFSGGMSQCVRCHDSKTASSACKTCHTGDPALATRDERVFPKIRVANRDCGGCHDQRPCDACHGTRMPHSETFKKYGHAPFAVFEKKQSCFRCHDQKDCGKCHGDWDAGHGPLAATKRQHFAMGRAVWSGSANCSCHAHNKYRNFCALCHKQAEPLF